MLKQELLHQKAIFTKNRLEYMEKGKQIAIALDYLSWPNQSLKLTNTFFKHKKCQINNCQIEISQKQKHIEEVTTQKPDLLYMHQR